VDYLLHWYILLLYLPFATDKGFRWNIIWQFKKKNAYFSGFFTLTKMAMTMKRTKLDKVRNQILEKLLPSQ